MRPMMSVVVDIAGSNSVAAELIFRRSSPHLKDVKFRGWAVIELDSVPDKSRTPKESALISKKYVEDKLGIEG